MSLVYKGVKMDISAVQYLAMEVVKGKNGDRVCAAMISRSGTYPSAHDVLRLLFRWVEAERTGGEYPKGRSTGKRDEARVHKDETSLARAVIGELTSIPRRRVERAVASAILESGEISRALDAVLTLLFAKLQGVANGMAIIKELGEISAKPTHGSYETHLGLTGRLDVMMSPAKYPVWRKIVVLHDMMEYLQPEVPHIRRTEGTGLVPNPHPDAYRSVRLAPDALEMFRFDETATYIDKGRGKQRGPEGLWNRDEESPATIASRVGLVPVWAGQSMTTARMLETALWAGAGPDALDAVAHAIFAYWANGYDQQVSPVHTYDEVMQVAMNYGVRYDPFGPPRMPGHPAPSRGLPLRAKL